MLYGGRRVGMGAVGAAFPECDPAGIERERDILAGRGGLFAKCLAALNGRQKTIDLKRNGQTRIKTRQKSHKTCLILRG